MLLTGLTPVEPASSHVIGVQGPEVKQNSLLRPVSGPDLARLEGTQE